MPRPRLTAVVVAGAVVLSAALSGCGGAVSPGPGNPSEGAAPVRPVRGVSLVTTGTAAPEPAFGSGDPPVTRVTGAGTGLLIRYSVRNRRASPVLVVDRLPGQGATMSLTDEPDPLSALLRVRSGNRIDVVKTARLGSAGLDYTPQVQASVVPPGTVHTGRAYVAFPVQDYSGANPFPTDAATWRLCLGVVARADRLTSRSPDGTVALVPGAGFDQESLVCDDERPLPDGWRG